MSKLPLRRHRALLALLPLALAACSHDDHDPKVKVALPDYAAGVHAVVVDGDSAVRDGTAFVGSKGAAYVVMSDDSNAASQVVYRRDKSSSSWRRVPQATADMTLAGKLDSVQTVAALSLPAAATTYRARIGETTASFTLSADGKLAASADGCKLGGKIVSADLGNASSAKLTLSGCNAGDGAADGDYDGIAYADPDAPNAALRFVVDNGSVVRDFYAYAP